MHVDNVQITLPRPLSVHGSTIAYRPRRFRVECLISILGLLTSPTDITLLMSLLMTSLMTSSSLQTSRHCSRQRRRFDRLVSRGSCRPPPTGPAMLEYGVTLMSITLASIKHNYVSRKQQVSK